MKRIVKLTIFLFVALFCICGVLVLAVRKDTKNVPVRQDALEFSTATIAPATALPAPSTFTATAPPKNTPAPPTKTPPPTSTPAPPTATAVPLGLEVVSLTSPVLANSTAHAEIMTEPGVNCSIYVFYKSGASKADGLEPMVAGDDGLCAWSWTVGPQTAAGEFHVTFQAFLNGRHNQVSMPFSVVE